MLIEKRELKIDENVCRYVRSRYTMIDVEPVQGMFNFRCHENSVQWAKSRPGFGIAEVIYIENGKPVLHYINTKDDKFYETTLGWRADNMEYYKIRDIHESDWMRIHSEFSRSLESWLMQFTTWFDRKVLRIDRIM